MARKEATKLLQPGIVLRVLLKQKLLSSYELVMLRKQPIDNPLNALHQNARKI